MKVLHVTNWYPHEQNPQEALWIQRHINSLADFVESSFTLHIEVKPANKFCLIKANKENFNQRIFYVPIKSWFLIEVLTTFLLVFYLIKLKAPKKFDIINFHIAYPVLTYWHLINKFINIPVLITEHWSAYHFNFNIRKAKKLRRIKRIFQQGIPLICVSEHLKEDIQKFAGNFSFPAYIIPNVVSKEFINCSSHQQNATYHSFFMVSSWKWPKRPDIAIEAFAKFMKETGDKYTLRIGGYGPLLPEMEKQVAELGITDKVKFLGKMNSATIADEMNLAIAFIHCSEYETFSVVCAEALCSGCPVIASSAGGIKELVDSSSGILVEKNDESSWEHALKQFDCLSFNKEEIAIEAVEKYSTLGVGERYSRVLSKIISETKG